MTRTTENTLEMLETALAMEREGEGFFREAAASCYNPTGKMIFDMLCEDEKEHLAEIQGIYDQLQGNAGSSFKPNSAPRRASPEAVRALIAQHAKQHRQTIEAHPGDLQALEIGLDFERRTAAFYREHLPGAAPETRLFLEHLIAEEERHLALLTELKELLTDPGTWLRALQEEPPEAE